MVGAAFNVLFLAYVAVGSAAGFALVFSLPRIEMAELAAGLSRRRAAQVTALSYLGVTAAGLGVLWTALSAGFLATRQVPAPVVAAGHPTAVVFALDVAVVVPAMTLAAVAPATSCPSGWHSPCSAPPAQPCSSPQTAEPVTPADRPPRI